ncbi:hypothetical protein Tco_0373333 [Tanacetum coccineum]
MKRASKGYTRVDTPLFQTMLVQGQILQGKGSTILVESHRTPISAPSTSQPPTSPPSMQTTHVVKEANTMPHDSPLLRVYLLRSDEGSMTLNELTVLCTTLSKKVETLESDLKKTKLTYDAAYIKLIMKLKKLEHKLKSSKARRRVRLVTLEDEDKLEDPSKHGRKIAQINEDKGITLFIAPEEDYTAKPDISTANVPVSTAGAEVSTASSKVKTAAEKERQRIARVHEEASTFNAEEWDNIHAQIEADKELAHRLQAQERERYSEADKARLLVELINERATQKKEQAHESSSTKDLHMWKLFISQDKYATDILKKFDFTTVKAARTPIETSKALNKDEEAEDMDVDLYRSMIGSLMYLTTSRLDIMFAVCACVRFQVTPKTSHLHVVKRVFRYLKEQPKLGLWYPKDSPFDLEAFYDSDYARASLDRKSTTGGCQFLSKRLISWQCKKQTIVANSTTEAEYVAAANCCGQVLWIQNQMLDYGFNFMNTKIHIDNESTICIVKNPVFHSKTKHIEIRHHFIRDSYEKKLDERKCNIQQKWMKGQDNPLIPNTHLHLLNSLMKNQSLFYNHINPKRLKNPRKAKRTTEISQSSGPIHLVADETVYKEWEDLNRRDALLLLA